VQCVVRAHAGGREVRIVRFGVARVTELILREGRGLRSIAAAQECMSDENTTAGDEDNSRASMAASGIRRRLSEY
jgi:hypothetical protein